MPSTEPFKCFKNLKDLLGVASKQRAQVIQQQETLDQLLGPLDELAKERIRAGMTFTLKKGGSNRKNRSVKSLSGGGQMDELETEDATSRYRSISAEDKRKAEEAMAPVFAVLQTMRTNKVCGDPDSDDEKERERARRRISQELFEPLVREGVIPEWVVPAAYSKTQRYLDAAFQRYKETLEQQRQDKIKKHAKTELNLAGAGDWKDKAQAISDKASRKLDNLQSDLLPKGTDEEKKRKLKLMSAEMALAFSAFNAVRSVDSMNKVFNDPNHNQGLVGQTTQKHTYTKMGIKLQEAGIPDDKIMPLLAWLDEQKSDGTQTFVVSGIKTTIDLVTDLGTIGKEIKDLLDTKDVIDAIQNGAHEAQLEVNAAKLIPQIDAALVEMLSKVNPVAGAAAQGIFEASVSTIALVEIASANPPRADELIDGLADGLEEALANCVPDDKLLKAVGQDVKKKFLSEVSAAALDKSLQDPKTSTAAFETLLKAVKKALAAALAVAGDDGAAPDANAPGASTAAAFELHLAGRAVQDAIIKNVTKRVITPPDDIKELSEEEILEYECALTLSEEGGELMALQQPIEKLIAQLERGQQALDVVEQCLQTILGAASSGVGIARAAVDVGQATVTTTADTLGNEVLPALKAAKVVLRMMVELETFAELYKLWEKFKVQVERAEKAGSPLSPAIRNFRDNKKEQLVFHGIQQAMLAIQLAGSICQATHEPHTMAAGKALNAVGVLGEQANKVAELKYNESQLRKAWATTTAAVNNPANRKLGLKALLINPTLAMHAVAYAAKVEQDPTARNFLKACGLNESTLDLGASEEKIREYLTVLLSEDRQLLDFEKIKTDWQPSTLELTKANWIIACGAAMKRANPKLRKDQPGGIADALGKLELAASYLKPLLAASQDDLDELLDPTKGDHVAKLAILQATAQSLNRDFDNYTPHAVDGTAHKEMQLLVLQYLELGEDLDNRLGMLLEKATAQVTTPASGGGESHV